MFMHQKPVIKSTEYKLLIRSFECFPTATISRIKSGSLSPFVMRDNRGSFSWMSIAACGFHRCCERDLFRRNGRVGYGVGGALRSSNEIKSYLLSACSVLGTSLQLRQRG